MSKRRRKKKRPTQHSRSSDPAVEKSGEVDSLVNDGTPSKSRSPLVMMIVLVCAMVIGWSLFAPTEELPVAKKSSEVVKRATSDRVVNDDEPKTEEANSSIAGTAGSGTKIEAMPTTETQQANARRIRAGLDPAEAGWQSEAFNELASQQLKKLAHLIEHPKKLNATAASKLVSDDFRSVALRPTAAEEVFRDSTIVVFRAPSNELSTNWIETTGANALVEIIRTLPEPSEGGEYHVKFKVVGVSVDQDQGSATTEVYAEGGGPGGDTLAQWRANWRCEWLADANGEAKLRSISISNYEQVDSLAGTQPWLVDYAPVVLGDDPSYREQLAYGMEYWLRRMEGRVGVSRLGHNGIALGDVNNDGREDVYVCQSGGLPNRLFLAQADGTARDIAQQAGVDILDDTTCALFVDLDNDGNQDLVLMTISGGLVLSGDGTGKFEKKRILHECRNAFSLTAADYDNDSLLDLYVGRYWPTSENRGEIAIPVPYYDAQNGGRNLLFRNVGDWEFQDVTTATGLDVENTRYTMAAAWNDFDQDGRIDLYVANDFGRNCLYRNLGGSFENVAASAGVEDSASGMSVTFGDFDRDGLDDLYVSNMFSSAGSRTTYQRQYAERFGAEGVRNMQRMARGNTLFRNTGNGDFEDISELAGVTMGRWAWGSLFSDLNNDGLEDIVVLNGNITTEDTGDL